MCWNLLSVLSCVSSFWTFVQLYTYKMLFLQGPQWNSETDIPVLSLPGLVPQCPSCFWNLYGTGVFSRKQILTSHPKQKEKCICLLLCILGEIWWLYSRVFKIIEEFEPFHKYFRNCRIFHVAGIRLKKWTNHKIYVCFAQHFSHLGLPPLLG